ncbi:MAG: cytochrome c [Chloroflexota bacterium]
MRKLQFKTAGLTAVLSFITFYFFSVAPAQAQTEIPEDADPVIGIGIYQERCSACHGELGLGDGELAANLENPVPPIGSPDYLAAADPSQMFTIINNGNLAGGMPGFGAGNNSNPLGEGDIWNVISSLYQLELLNSTIETARITGVVQNGTTGGVLDTGDIVLQAITPEFEEGGRFTTSIQPDGSFVFDLSNLPPDWFYRVFVPYNEITFPSDFVNLNPLENEAELPVIVYESTTSPRELRVLQLQILVDFLPDSVQVAEWYTFSFTEDKIFVGEEGVVDGGTAKVIVPESANEVLLLQGLGGVNDFVPITDPVINGDTWQARVPVYPGDATLQLLVRYNLPYESGLTLRHQLPYPTDFIDLSMPKSGALINTETDWRLVPEEVFTQEPSTRNSFTRSPMPPNSDIEFTIEGFPSVVIGPDGEQIVNRNEQQELFIGIAALALTLLAGAWIGYGWVAQEPNENLQDDLVKRLAALDLAYKEKSIGKRAYQNRRKQLKAQLKTIWES